MSLAKAVFTGTITRSPEKRFTSNNIPITAFTMNISINAGEEELIRVLTKGKLAETMVNLVNKGDKVIVDGRLQNAVVKMEDGSEKRISEVDAMAVEKISSGQPAAPSQSDDIVKFADEEIGDNLIGEEEIPF